VEETFTIALQREMRIEAALHRSALAVRHSLELLKRSAVLLGRGGSPKRAAAAMCKQPPPATQITAPMFREYSLSADEIPTPLHKSRGQGQNSV
jgi:hypothetical protein